jgi:hypothetical protein
VNCKACSRSAAANGFCSLHLEAYKNIIEKFALWQRATEIVWVDYLIQIQKNSLTGIWAKEVAKCLIEDESRHVEENKEEHL